MEIGNTSHGHAHRVERHDHHRTDHKAKKTKHGENLSAATKVEHEEHKEHDDTRGVIRLLESGHFKGVSDVRLRINFAEELQARSDARTQAATQAGVTELKDTVVNEAGALLEDAPLDDDTRAAINEALATFGEAMGAATETPDEQGNVEQQVRLAFDGLTATMNELFATPVEPPTVETPTIETPVVEVPAEEDPAEEDIVVPTDGVAEPQTPTEPTVEPFDISPIIANLTSSFEQSMTQLLSSVEAASTLGSLAPAPANHGSAYQKFLAIYQEMSNPVPAPAPGDAPAVEPEPEEAIAPTEGTDTEA